MGRSRINVIQDKCKRTLIQKFEDFLDKSQIFISIYQKTDNQFLKLIEQIRQTDTIQYIKMQDWSFEQNFSNLLNLLQQSIKSQKNLNKLKIVFSQFHSFNEEESKYLKECITETIQNLNIKFEKTSLKNVEKILKSVKNQENIKVLKLQMNLKNKVNANNILQLISKFNHLKKMRILINNSLFDVEKTVCLQLEECEYLETSIEIINTIQNLKLAQNLRDLTLVVDKTESNMFDRFLNIQIPVLQNLHSLNLNVIQSDNYYLRFLESALPQLIQTSQLQIVYKNGNDTEFSKIASLLNNNNQIKQFTYYDLIKNIQFQESDFDMLFNIQHLRILALDNYQRAYKFLRILTNLITIQLYSVKEKKNILKVKRLVSYKIGY
ncbi:hypothetical protein ABPG72_019096 [Tetrahymena utriculariae]